ncbi:unnamed protein product, partial [Leptidea sinapis]
MQNLKNFSSCHKNVVQIEDRRSHLVANRIWLLFTKKNIILTETCKEEAKKYNLKVTFLVIPNRSCEKQIGDKVISKVAKTRTPEVKLLLNPVTMPELQQEIRIEDNQVELRGVDIKDIFNSAKYNSENGDKNEMSVTQDIVSSNYSEVVSGTTLIKSYRYRTACARESKRDFIIFVVKSRVLMSFDMIIDPIAKDFMTIKSKELHTLTIYNGDEKFQTREAVERVRNCTQLDKTVIDTI